MKRFIEEYQIIIISLLCTLIGVSAFIKVIGGISFIEFIQKGIYGL